MNRDEIIRMARKSAILDVMDCQYPAVDDYHRGNYKETYLDRWDFAESIYA